MLLTEIRTYPHNRYKTDATAVKLQVDGVEVMRGDEYHDKIDAQIRGFELALKFLNKEYTKQVWMILQQERIKSAEIESRTRKPVKPSDILSSVTMRTEVFLP